jgi:hypothetical protein
MDTGTLLGGLLAGLILFAAHYMRRYLGKILEGELPALVYYVFGTSALLVGFAFSAGVLAGRWEVVLAAVVNAAIGGAFVALAYLVDWMAGSWKRAQRADRLIEHERREQ